MNKKRFRIDFNSPIILWMAILSFAFLVLDMIFGKRIGPFLSAYRTSIADPMQYLRLFTHVLVHSDISHYTGNFMMILAIGPMVEEKYSSSQLLLVTICTAVITGLVNVLFFPGKAVLGASGIVFMLILLASFTNIQQGKLPITVPLVAILYIGNEVLKGLFSIDNISQISHIIGGICGALFGIAFHSIRFRAKAKAKAD